MITQEDIYSKPTDPTGTINPKTVGAFYINTKTAKLFVCTDNTINKNVWKMCNPDVVIPKYEPDGLGYNQTYTTNNNPKVGVWYKNNTTRPIFVICIINTDSRSQYQNLYIKSPNGEETKLGAFAESTLDDIPLTAIVPVNWYYRINQSINGGNLWVLN